MSNEGIAWTHAPNGTAVAELAAVTDPRRRERESPRRPKVNVRKGQRLAATEDTVGGYVRGGELNGNDLLRLC